jgi:hypothetical protein
MFGMPPPGFDDLIALKYQQQKFGLDSARIQAIAQANLANTQAGSIPATTAAQVEESKARSGLYGKQGQESTARSGLYGAQSLSEQMRNQWYGPEAQARINLDNSSAGLNRANALGPTYNYSSSNLDPAVAAGAYSKSQAQMNGGVAPMVVPGGGSDTSVTPGGMITQDDDDGGHRMGVTRIGGRGNGTKDTVKTKLAPGEAVLNRSAADMIGRGLIAHANKLGAARMGMGMVNPKQAPAGPAGYKRGTSSVGGKKAPAMDTTALTNFLRAMSAGPPGAGLPGAAGGMGSPAGLLQGAPPPAAAAGMDGGLSVGVGQPAGMLPRRVGMPPPR